MKKILSFLKNNIFLLTLLLLLIVTDIILTRVNPLKYCDSIHKDDFELTQLAHPERVWDKVFFGNSSVISGYLEEESVSGYVNLDMDYGMVTRIKEMLEGGPITVGSELVLGLNWDSMYDEMDTDPTYAWHKDWYEPYFYFQRDRLNYLITNGVTRKLNGWSFFTHYYAEHPDGKEYYHGRMTEEEMDARMVRLYDLFWSHGTGMYEENLAALADVFDFCAKNDIRVRVVWLPWNPEVEQNECDLYVYGRTMELCQERGVEFYDMTDALPAECFYDTGHLNYEVGAPAFTEMIDPWLIS